MRIDVTILADDMIELREALEHVAATLPSNIFGPRSRAFSISCQPHFDDSTATPYQGSRSAPPPPGDPDPDPQPAAPAATPRKRRTAAEIAADKAAADKAAAAPPAEADEDPFASMQPADDPGLSPAEAKLKALDMLREAYGLPGGPAAIKAVQVEYGVAKFVEVAESVGRELHARASALLASLKKA